MKSIIEQLEWSYHKLHEFLTDAYDLGEKDTVNRIEATIIQLRITIDALKKELASETST